MNKNLFILILLFSITAQLKSQDFFKIKGDFTIKSKSDSISGLTIGSFYYDNTKKKIIYNISFPFPEVWIFSDTTIYHFKGDSLIKKESTPSLNEFSIFHLALNNHLTNYGLENSLYNIEEVGKEGDMVITTYSPPEVMNTLLGKVVLSAKKKRLYGIVFLDTEEEILRKQIFKEYHNFNGLEFPGEIIDIFYTGDQKEKTTYQKTIYTNILVNETDDNRFYDFKLPAEYSNLISK